MVFPPGLIIFQQCFYLIDVLIGFFKFQIIKNKKKKIAHFKRLP